MARMQKTSFRILVVDDEPSVCKAYKMLLNRYGHDVSIVHDGRAALSLLESEQFDLVMTDYFMPNMMGDELAARIKQRLPDQRIIMVSSFTESFLASGTPPGGADGLLGKPFLNTDLVSAISKVMAGSIAGGQRT